MKASGFTLIELMIVVAIIGVLASIALPVYQEYTKRSHFTEGIYLAAAAKTAIVDYHATYHEYPKDNEAAGMAAKVSGKGVESLKVKDNKIIITFNKEYVEGGVVTFEGKLNSKNNFYEWSCTKNDKIPNSFVSKNCRSTK